VTFVFVTQVVDPASPVLGATVAKIRALADRVDEVTVLADAAVAGVLPANCRVRLFRSATKAGRGLRFEAALGRELARRPRPVAVLAHMCPIYAVLAAPLARPVGARVLLWFTHWKTSRLLRLAERVSSAVVTVEPRTFPLASRKLVPIGHGIDLSGFPCVERRADEGLTLLSLARTSPAKGLETVLRAVALVPEARLWQHGPSLTDEERRHRAELDTLVDELGIGERVVIGDAVPRDEVPALLAGADALVNNMRFGATDKVVYEAGATCLPVLASNPALDGFLPSELRFEREDPASLAERIRALADADRAALGRLLRERVTRDHSVEGWADRVLEVATSARLSRPHETEPRRR
jgi:glycosyltransferase involved in cell wall biosynthesis